jgi:hypothetical protein
MKYWLVFSMCMRFYKQVHFIRTSNSMARSIKFVFDTWCGLILSRYYFFIQFYDLFKGFIKNIRHVYTACWFKGEVCVHDIIIMPHLCSVVVAWQQTRWSIFVSCCIWIWFLSITDIFFIYRFNFYCCRNT